MSEVQAWEIGSSDSIHKDEVLLISTEDGDVVHVDTRLGKITPKEIWENKETWFATAAKSREAWEAMTIDQQDALTRMVTGGLERMHDRVQDWLPEGLIVEGGNYIDVHLRFLFTDIDKEIDRNEQATSFQIKAAKEETKKALAEMEAKEAKSGD